MPKKLILYPTYVETEKEQLARECVERFGGDFGREAISRPSGICFNAVSGELRESHTYRWQLWILEYAENIRTNPDSHDRAQLRTIAVGGRSFEVIHTLVSGELPNHTYKLGEILREVATRRPEYSATVTRIAKYVIDETSRLFKPKLLVGAGRAKNLGAAIETVAAEIEERRRKDLERAAAPTDEARVAGAAAATAAEETSEAESAAPPPAKRVRFTARPEAAAAAASPSPSTSPSTSSAESESSRAVGSHTK